jgi:hypothetical protein
MVVSRQLYAPSNLYSGERAPSVHCTADWMKPGKDLEIVMRKENFLLSGIEPKASSHFPEWTFTVREYRNITLK